MREGCAFSFSYFLSFYFQRIQAKTFDVFENLLMIIVKVSAESFSLLILIVHTYIHGKAVLCMTINFKTFFVNFL